MVRVAGNCHDIILESNKVHDTATLGGSNGEGFYIGTAVAGGVDNTYNVIVRSNIVFNTISEGIEFKPGSHDCIAEGNIMYNCSTVDPFRTIEIDEIGNWGSNPNHIVRNNIIHDSKTPIRAGTGCTIYNNIIYSISSSYVAISVDNLAGDSYPRRIYHNTLDVSSSRAVSIGGGSTDIRNNIGPSTANNLATSIAYYLNAINHDYHLVSGSAPVDAGVNLSGIVSVDFDGNKRPSSGLSVDIGAFEYVIGNKPPTPQNLHVVSAP